MVHEMRLYEKSFKEVLNGSQKFNVRLYDEKRKLLNLGDIIVFHKFDEPEKTIMVRVIGLFRTISFHNLFITIDPELTGAPEKAHKKAIEMSELYSDSYIPKHEVLGIQFVFAD